MHASSSLLLSGCPATVRPLHDLVEAEHKHRRFLEDFWCGPIPFRQAKKMREPHPQLYAIRVQSIVRALRPRRKFPDQIIVTYAEDLQLVKSVAWYTIALSGDGSHVVTLHAIATHTAFTQLGHAQSVYQTMVENCIGIAQDSITFESVTFVALVHPDNYESKSLLTKNQWAFTGLYDIDTVHEEWALVVGVE